MTNVSRMEQELADALGLAQAVRAATQHARGRTDDAKVTKRLQRIDSELDELQERVNAEVVADRGKRAKLTARSRSARERAFEAADGDAIDAVQEVVAASAHHLAQWIVLDRLANVAGDKPARKLAQLAIPLVEEHVESGLRACRRLAKQTAKSELSTAEA